ncbi:glycosyltransferase family 87 protein [Streptomyces sp. NPDC051219]|uniref:glycosyltransferase family 87 protein n=1 Tax=Streptomyces sp. NPDC051219 TaxID=3155283 RepID=UPI003436B257
MKTDKADNSPLVLEWLLRPASWVCRAAVSAILLVVLMSVALRAWDGGMDNAFVVRAADALLEGRSPYADKRFLYLPSAVLAAVPEALLPLRVLRMLVPSLIMGLLLAGWGFALRIFSVPLGSRFAALGLAGLALGFVPFGNLVLLGNWTAVSAAALPLALLLAHRSRWVAAGLVIGVAIAFKPMLVPIGLLFVFARQWRGLAVAVLLPAAASVLGALVMPNPTFFFTRTLPFLLNGQDDFALIWDASPVAVLPRLGVPRPAAFLIAALAAAAGVWCAWRRWRRADSGPLRIVETGTMLMLAAFLVSRPSFDHYLMVVLPLLLASGAAACSAPRSPWFWIALVPQVGGFYWPYVTEPPTRRAFKDLATLCVLALTVMWCCLRPRRATVVRTEQPATPEATVVAARTPF